MTWHPSLRRFIARAPVDDIDGSPADVLLQPGESHFGTAGTRIRTLLGSCIAITMWNPVRRIGGMTHCLLHGRAVERVGEPDCRFVDESTLWLLREATRRETDPAEYEFKLFGGGDMYHRLGLGNRNHVGRRNSATAELLLGNLGLPITAHDVGGAVYRALVFDIATGAVWVRYGDDVAPPAREECIRT
jgi:chemotaxis protein CheD